MLEVKNVTKYYQTGKEQFKALDNVNFSIEPGNMVAIVGPSGGGKTTLMNILGALDSAFEGDVIVNGKSLKNAAGKDIESYRKNTIGFVFQNFTLINSLTAFENVELALEISNVSKKQRRQKVMDLLTSVGLEKHAKKKVNVLSGGQKQRVAIARALANDPDIILADEPTGALDHENSIEVMNLLAEIAKTKTVIMVTHNPELANEYANIIMNISDGKLTSVVQNKPSSNVTQAQSNTNTKANMPLRTAFMLALRNLKLKKGRTLATAIGMSIGIIGIALAIALSDGTRTAIKNQVLSIFPANAITATVKDDDKKSNDDERIKYKDFEKIEKIADDAQSIFYQPISYLPTVASFDKDSADIAKYRENMLKGKEAKDPTTMVTAIMPYSSYDAKLGYGHKPNPKETNEIMLSLSTAQELIKDNQKVEDIIGKKLYVSVLNMENRDMSNSKTIPLTITGITSENTLFSTLYVEQNFFKNILDKYFDADINDTETTSVMLTTKDVDHVSEYAKKLNEKTDKYEFSPSAQSVLNTVNSILDLVRNVLIAFSSVSVFIAVLMIAIVIYISVLERKMEIGIIRAIGGRMKDIRNMFVCESMLIGLLSGIIGIGISYLICGGINTLVTNALRATNEHVPAMDVAVLTPQAAIALLIITTLLAIISGLIPSLQAAKLDPVQAIRKQ